MEHAGRSERRAPSPALVEAAHALQGNALDKAERLIRSRLAAEPEDVEALRLLARVAAATGLAGDAEQLLRRAIALAPGFVLAHVDLAWLLCRLERAEEALAMLDEVIASRPNCLWALSLGAAILDGERRVEEALALHETLVKRAPDAAAPWTSYGHALNTVGRVEEAVAAYRKALQLDPGNGFAWWGLANLRTVRLEADDIARLERALQNPGDDLQRVQLHFALGKALGDQGRFEPSFRHYEKANRIRGGLVPYDPGGTSELVERIEAVFTAEFLAQRSGQGCDAPDPIFIVGMPRSGSTLVEQILASHPMVEGLGELVQLDGIAVRAAASSTAWPEAAARAGADELRALGQTYLHSTRRYRTTDRPFFTDKMPANWRYVGLIRLILPNAKIVDVRRHPLACCLSTFATYFSGRTSVPASLTDLGRFYRDYVRAMAHFDAVQPSRIHRVHYERLVDDPGGEVRRLLAYLDLPFDENCLRFHENPRPVHTPSAQQVRRPINRDGIERWRNYEPWLTPLKDALGPLLDDAPAAGRIGQAEREPPIG